MIQDHIDMTEDHIARQTDMRSYCTRQTDMIQYHIDMTQDHIEKQN